MEQDNKPEIVVEAPTVKTPSIQEQIDEGVRKALEEQGTSIDNILDKKLTDYYQKPNPYAATEIEKKIQWHRTNAGYGLALDDFRKAKGETFIHNGENILTARFEKKNK